MRTCCGRRWSEPQPPPESPDDGGMLSDRCSGLFQLAGKSRNGCLRSPTADCPEGRTGTPRVWGALRSTVEDVGAVGVERFGLLSSCRAERQSQNQYIRTRIWFAPSVEASCRAIERRAGWKCCLDMRPCQPPPPGGVSWQERCRGTALRRDVGLVDVVVIRARYCPV